MIETSLSQSEPVMLPDRSIGPVARSIAAHALLMAMMIASQLLVVFVPAVVFHCALRNGRRSAAWTASALAVALYALFAVAQPRPEQLAANLALMDVAFMALAVVLPSLVALPLVERGDSFGRVLMALLLGSMAGLGIAEVGFRAGLAVSPYAVYVAQIQEQNTSLIAFYRERGAQVDVLQEWFAATMVVLPGILIVTMALVFTLSLLMLGRLKTWHDYAVSRAANRGGEAMFGAYLFRNFALPEWVLFAFLAGGLMPLTTGLLHKIAANTLLVVAVLYLLQGLAIFRSILGTAGITGVAAMLSWLVLFLLMPTGVGLLLPAMAGLFDPFFDFRHFKKRKDDSHESHSD